jgi:hypothetical protein
VVELDGAGDAERETEELRRRWLSNLIERAHCVRHTLGSDPRFATDFLKFGEGQAFPGRRQLACRRLFLFARPREDGSDLFIGVSTIRHEKKAGGVARRRQFDLEAATRPNALRVECLTLVPED